MHFYIDIKLGICLVSIVYILFCVIKGITQLIEMKYLTLKYEEVRSLIQSSERSFWLWWIWIAIVNIDANLFEIYLGTRGIPLIHKIHLHQDYIILTCLGKYAEIFKKSECKIKKITFYSFLECVKNNKKYCIYTIGHTKQIQEWLNK